MRSGTKKMDINQTITTTSLNLVQDNTWLQALKNKSKLKFSSKLKSASEKQTRSRAKLIAKETKEKRKKLTQIAGSPL